MPVSVSPAFVLLSTLKLDSGFVAPSNYQTADVNCHKNAVPGEITFPSPRAALSSSSGAPMRRRTHTAPSSPTLADCKGDCSKVDKTQLRRVKIEEAGIDYTTQEWASAKLIANNGTWKTKIPRSIAPGDYFLRHEIIALHGANSLNGRPELPPVL
ncbi:hypothetical protein DL771_004315 [Monosporascus sp. 5C6A]|nr:hypothetical protein DL771_004315 [Monosporascus sp. 5C6A]